MQGGDTNNLDTLEAEKTFALPTEGK